MTKKELKIALIAGEASGDILGAALMADLKQKFKDHEIIFIGIGGQNMQREGLNSLLNIEELSVMGLLEVLPRLPKLIKYIDSSAKFITKEKPDILITIDSPDFCHRVTQKIRKSDFSDLPIFHYVAPTVWAWRPERAAKLAGLYDGLMCLFPFEPAYFEKEGLPAYYTGHPALKAQITYEKEIENKNKSALYEGYGLEQGRPVLGVFFGSRLGELNRIGPEIRETIALYKHKHNDMQIICPTLPHLAPVAKNLLQSMNIKPKPAIITDSTKKHEMFGLMDMAIATSGTIGLELALANIPHIITYKLNPLTHQLVKNKITSKYAHLANIIMDKEIVPEYIQQDCHAEELSQALMDINAEKQQKAFGEVREKLGDHKNKKAPADIIAEALTKTIL